MASLRSREPSTGVYFVSLRASACDGRRLDVLRRREVRLADAEHDDVAALLAQPLRARRDADGGGRANALQPLRELDGQTGDLFLGGRGYLKMHDLERQPAPHIP